MKPSDVLRLPGILGVGLGGFVDGSGTASFTPDLGGEVVVDASGTAHRYVVSSRRSYLKSSLPEELFAPGGPPRLALVTCGGAFDEATGHYAENVVVMADLA